jgi:hypothetical protein
MVMTAQENMANLYNKLQHMTREFGRTTHIFQRKNQDLHTQLMDMENKVNHCYTTSQE